MARRGSVSLDLSQPERELKELGANLRKIEGGKDLRKELVREIRDAAGPARNEARRAIKAMPSAGTRRGGRSLRSAIAQKVKIEARPTGRYVGARVSVGATESTRGFTQAPRRTNSKSWRHPVFGNRNKWVSQRGQPDWFDGTMQSNRPRFRNAVTGAIDDFSRKIARLL